jgi:hypothetical protein
LKYCYLFLCFVLCGCAPSYNPSANPDPIEVTGTVTIAGQPVAEAVLNLQSIERGKGLPAALNVVKGEFKGKITPGVYTYYLSAGRNANLFKTVPEKYHAGDMTRKLEVSSSTTTLTVTFE